MRRLFGDNASDAVIGLLVVLVAAWFVVYAWHRTGGGAGGGAIHVTALFPNASGVSPGTDVRVAGLKVGSVSAQKLDPKSYQAEVTLALDPDVKVPADSSAAITSEGLLGSTYIALVPGGDTAVLKNGDTILDTQGAMDLMGLVGQFINKSGGSGAGAGGTAPAAAQGGAGAAR